MSSYSYATVQFIQESNVLHSEFIYQTKFICEILLHRFSRNTFHEF